jgi:hypothetical protein
MAERMRLIPRKRNERLIPHPPMLTGESFSAHLLSVGRPHQATRGASPAASCLSARACKTQPIFSSRINGNLPPKAFTLFARSTVAGCCSRLPKGGGQLKAVG